MTAWLVVRVLALFCFSVQAYTGSSSRCPSATECKLANRAPCPDPVQGYCGACLPGYVQDSLDVCIRTPLKTQAGAGNSSDNAVVSAAAAVSGSCPESRLCAASFRQPCTASSSGNCGSCLPDYIDVEGICISEDDAVALLQFIEADVSRRNEKLLTSADTDAPASQQLDGANDLKQRVTGDSNTAAGGSRGGDQAVVMAEAPGPKGIGNATPDLLTSSLAHADSNSNVSDQSAAAGTIHDSGVAVAQIQAAHLPSVHDINQLTSIVLILGAALLAAAAITTASVYWYRLVKKRRRDGTSEPTKRFSSSSSSGSLDDRWHHGSPKGGIAASAVLSPPGGFDKKLAQSALMYHFEHSKQQIVTRQKAVASKDLASENSDSDADDEAEACKTEQGDYTVYECPGLAPTSDLEVRNPLFDSASVRKSASLDSNSNSSIASPAEERRK